MCTLNMSYGNAEDSKENNILRKRHVKIDDDLIESLKQYYKIEDSGDSEILQYIEDSAIFKYLKDNRRTTLEG